MVVLLACWKHRGTASESLQHTEAKLLQLLMRAPAKSSGRYMFPLEPAAHSSA